MRKRYKISGLDFLGGSQQEVVRFILDSRKDSGACLVTSAGIRQCILAKRMPHFKDILNEFDVVSMGGHVVKTLPERKFFHLEQCDSWDILVGTMKRAWESGHIHHCFVGENEKQLQSLCARFSSVNSDIRFEIIAQNAEIVSEQLVSRVKENSGGKALCIWFFGKSPMVEVLCYNSKDLFPGAKLIAVNSMDRRI